MLGVIVNVVAIVVGSLIGVFLNKGLPEKITKDIMAALGLATVVLGIQGAIKSENTLVLVISLALGTMIGSFIDIDKYIYNLGDFLKKKFVKDGDSNAKFVEGFVAASALFAIGAMAILGSIEAGLNHNYSILFVKSTLDFVMAIIYSSTMGIGVAFSAIVILIVQGGIAIFASSLTFLIENEGMMTELTAVGNVLIIAIGLNLIGIAKIKIANMLPAIILAPILYGLFCM